MVLNLFDFYHRKIKNAVAYKFGSKYENLYQYIKKLPQEIVSGDASL
jgi:IS1 family transposase